ncbi:MAG: hypothetical protein V4657_10090 [Pseudomonadota bacterium]
MGVAAVMGYPVIQNRIKPKPAKQKAHMARIATLPCLVCGNQATVHHVTAPVYGGRITRSDELTVPLCPRHHQIQHGPRESVEALGHGGFFATYGIDLEREAQLLWTESVMAGDA